MTDTPRTDAVYKAVADGMDPMGYSDAEWHAALSEALGIHIKKLERELAAAHAALREKDAALAAAGSELNDLRLDADGLRRDLERAEAALREARVVAGRQRKADADFLYKQSILSPKEMADLGILSRAGALNYAADMVSKNTLVTDIKNATPQASVSARTEGDQSSPPNQPAEAAPPSMQCPFTAEEIEAYRKEWIVDDAINLPDWHKRETALIDWLCNLGIATIKQPVEAAPRILIVQDSIGPLAAAKGKQT